MTSVADTGLNQLELGVCVGAWVGIFLLFSIIDVTGATTARLLRTWPGLISHALIVAARQRAFPCKCCSPPSCGSRTSCRR